MIQVRLQLEQISLGFENERSRPSASERLLQSVLEQQALASKAFALSHKQVHERLARLEALLQSQAEKMTSAQFRQMGPYLNQSMPPTRRNAVRAVGPDTESRIRARAVDGRLRKPVSACSSQCSCSCHVLRHSQTPAMLRGIIGQLFVGFSGVPMLSQKCDSVGCQKQQNTNLDIEFWFPLGLFWSQIVRFQMAYESTMGPSFQLSTLRQVPDSAICVAFALGGNINGLKNLFQQGLASPRDVNITRGYSLLRFGSICMLKHIALDYY